MFRSFRLGTMLGFPIYVNLTFLILLGVVGLTMGGFAAVAFVLFGFASVLLHELGHALVARHLGVRVPRIELHFFGGAAQMADQPRSAGDEIAIAAAGPAVSFALAGLSLLAGSALSAPLLHWFGQINVVIGAFNLIPALPMDGGRILRALLSRRMGFLPATQLSVKIARVAAVGLGLLGLFYWNAPYLAVLAVLLWLMTSAELHVATRLGGYAGAGPRDGEPEVLPRSPFRSPFDQFARPRVPRGGFVIRRDGYRFIIEPLD
jgi:Zn-dependent protease